MHGFECQGDIDAFDLCEVVVARILGRSLPTYSFDNIPQKFNRLFESARLEKAEVNVKKRTIFSSKMHLGPGKFAVESSRMEVEIYSLQA